MFGIYTDITERKKAEEALRSSGQFIRKILDTVDEGFIVIDRDFRILTANRAYCSQVGGQARRPSQTLPRFHRTL
jgi:PAS domain-containing protein